MAYSDNKHDSMEAGLLSTHREEERMLLKEDPYLDEHEEPIRSMEYSPRASPARRILMALGICFLVGIALVSITSATGVCPGHRNTNTGEVSIKDAVHRHNPNLSHAMGHMAKRQVNTPTASDTTTTTEESTTQPSSTSESSQESTTEAPTTTQETTTSEAETTTTEESSSTEETTSAAPTSTQATITGTGTKTTSSAVPKTITSTLPDGGVTTLTSTSWVEVVPAKATTSSKPNLQNAAPQPSVHGVITGAIGMIIGGLLLL
ncbi:hypothetical protein BGZ63DRAFT_424325 [Mariannaea sp. PMI_226]|nr:hypothetical protein BGZ63DRAFT_424325 [Mariannaea sp. PMI_226]